MNGNFAGLNALFGVDAGPVVVSDAHLVLKRFSEAGFRTLQMDEVSERRVDAPQHVFLVPATPAKHPNTELLAALQKSAVLIAPLLAFSHHERDIEYFISRLQNISFNSTCERNRSIIEFVQHSKEPITVLSPDCRLTVELGKNVDIMVPKLNPDISIGQWISIIQYLEIGLTPNADNTSFFVNGTLSCAGVTVAHHLHSHFIAGHIARNAWDIFSDLQFNGRFPLVLEIKNSKFISIFTRDGIDIIDQVLPLTDEIMRGGLTEVAFAALEANTDTDWTINSQLNEPAGGFHVGIGAGELAAHIDFISPDATWR